MSKIKMSDVFAMNVTLENSAGEGFLLKDNNCEYEEEYLAIIFDSNQARAITTAINNHDSLVKEVKRLRCQRDELVSMIGDLIAAPSGFYTGTGEITTERAIRLLAKIKGES